MTIKPYISISYRRFAYAPSMRHSVPIVCHIFQVAHVWSIDGAHLTHRLFGLMRLNDAHYSLVARLVSHVPFGGQVCLVLSDKAGLYPEDMQ